MKTKVRTFITVCVLAIAGINANATTNYSQINKGVVAEEEKDLKSLRADENMTGLNGKVVKARVDLNENDLALEEFQIEAQLETQLIADREEAKTIEMLRNKNIGFYAQMAQNENETERTEAHQITKWIADNQEAKTIQKLVADGKLTEVQ